MPRERYEAYGKPSYSDQVSENTHAAVLLRPVEMTMYSVPYGVIETRNEDVCE